jgi:uncharacterized protein (TIGR03435 family)
VLSGGLASGLAAQDTRPSFEVASVKINKSGQRQGKIDVEAGDTFTMVNQVLRTLINLAYRIPIYKLSGGPDWLTTERFDIIAKTPSGATLDQKMVMLQGLLEERFKLRIRAETREGAIYALVMARSDRRLGPDMRPAAADCAGQPFTASQPAPGVRPPCGAVGGLTQFSAGGIEMSQLASKLGTMMQETIVDRTGLAGRFDLDLRAVPSGRGGAVRPGVGVPPPAGFERPSIFTAVQEQLGLKLEPQRGTVEVFVIDSVQLPTPD